MTRGWERADNFELFDDVLPVLDELRAHGLKLGLVSNTGTRPRRVRRAPRARRRRRAHVAARTARRSRTPRSSARCSSGSSVEPADAAMVGDSIERRRRGRARDRHAAFLARPRGPPSRGSRRGSPTSRALPAALGTALPSEYDRSVPGWLIWAVVAVALAMGEIATPGLFFLGPVALAALVAGVVAAARRRRVGSSSIVFVVGVGRVARRPAPDRARAPAHARGDPHRHGRARRRAGARARARRRGRRPREDRRRGLERPRVHGGPGARARHAASRSRRSRARPRSSTNRRTQCCRTDRRLLVVAVARPRRARADDPHRPAGARGRRRAARPLPRTLDAGPRDRRAVRRPLRAADRPARAGRLVPAAAGDHRGQPRRQHRLGHLLPGHRPEGGDVRDRRTTSRRSSSSP